MSHSIHNEENDLRTDLGIGVGLRPAYYDKFLGTMPSTSLVSWVEVISENYMGRTRLEPGRPLQILERVRKNFPVVLHGVSMNLGSVDPLDRKYLDKLKELIEIIEPAWVSDHLAWTGVQGENLHDLLPLPYTQEALDVVTSKILAAQDHLKRRILIENPSTYLQFSHSEMTEPQFIREVLRRTDCGLLLDINNVYVCSVNHSFNPFEYLQSLPREKIGQIHLAGHSVKNTYLIDTHDSPVCAEVWELYRFATKIFGHVPTMIERDGNFPDWSEIESELTRAKEIHSTVAAVAV